MSLSPPPTYDAPYSTTTTTGLKPYLTLPYLYSLSWLAYPVISLIFVAFRLQSSLDSTNNAIDSAKANLLASCKAAEEAATSTASMPRYMALALNQQYSDAVNASLNAARATLVVSLTIMEAIINFIIDIYRSTLLCFVELVVRGGLAILIGAVEELNKVVGTAAGGIQDAIQSSVSGANSALKTAIDGINAVNPFDDITVPTIDTPDLSALNNVTLPDSFTQSLTSLNDSLPTFQDIKEKIEQVIDTPFELLKADINETFAGMSMNSSGMPVPEQNRISFCADMDTSVVDDLGHDLVKITKIGIIVIIVVALILIALNCLLEWYRWRCQERHFEYTRQAWLTDPSVHNVKGAVTPQVTLTNHNMLMLQATGAHPILTRISNRISSRLHLSASKHNNLQWFFNYIFYPPALACLLIGFFGLLAIEIQLIAMDPLVDRYSARAASTASDFSNSIATSINDSMFNQSAAYATSINTQVDAMQASINDGLFGWVNETTTTLNDTIVQFYDEVQEAVATVFNGTILEQAAQEFIRCLIGTKVDAIENALTFLHDNLAIDIPRMNNSALFLSQDQVNEASAPIAAAAIGGGEDDDGGVVGSLVLAYARSLEKERITFAIFLALWGFVVLMGICIILWHSYGKTYLEKRDRRKWQREQRGGDGGFVTPFVVGQPMDGSRDLPPSPRRGLNLPTFKLSRSVSSDLKADRSWDSFFHEKPAPVPRERTISQPRRLMALGRKGGKERLVPDHTEPDLQGDESDEPEDDKRSTAWFGRFANMLGKKQSEPVSQGASATSGSSRERLRPNLRISVGRASAANPKFPPPINGNIPPAPAQPQDDQRSRWSASPVLPPPAPWAKKVLSPTYKWTSKSRPPTVERDVPTDVNNTTYEEPTPVPSSLLAPPLHHGFENHDMNNGKLQPLPFLMPPLKNINTKSHRRSTSDSVPWFRADPYNTNSPRDVNPFVTPFDDEHRVSIRHSDPRKSMSTNPFAAVAL